MIARAAPSISVVVVTRDRPELLRDALRSVAAQRIPPEEVLIADDGELPAPDDVVTTALGSVRVLWACALRSAAAARNRASAMAGGDLLAFLDDDDRWMPDHLAGLKEAFRDSAVEFAWRDCAIVRERLGPGGGRRELARRVIARDWDRALMRSDDYLPPSAWGVRRSLFERLGGFDESFRFSEDWDFALRASACTTPRRVPGITVEVRMREQGNLSSEMGPERRECLDRLAARHGLEALEPKTFWEVALAVRAAGRRSTAATPLAAPG